MPKDKTPARSERERERMRCDNFSACQNEKQYADDLYCGWCQEKRDKEQGI